MKDERGKRERGTEDAPQIKDWGSCHKVTEGADCVSSWWHGLWKAGCDK